MAKIFKDIHTDKERALFGISDAVVSNCKFDGPEDGESALKETENLSIDNCYFNLRYPIWHTNNTVISNIEMTVNCSAAMWYDKNVKVSDSILHGPKVFRDCENIEIENCDIVSDEFAWSCKNVVVKNCSIESNYPFLKCKNVHLINCTLNSKYIFQYTENCVLENCTIETKDAFWECRNAKLIDCNVSSQYLAWHSDHVEFENCRITGTQPFCYCSNLVLNNCELKGCDLAFERSTVSVDVKGKIDSIRGPISGKITADEIGEILPSSSGDDTIEAEIVIRK